MAVVEIFKCAGCGREHQSKIYENASEAIADEFTEGFFAPIWDKLKEQAKRKSLEEFCKEIMFYAVYNYHRNKRRIRITRGSIATPDKSDKGLEKAKDG